MKKIIWYILLLLLTVGCKTQQTSTVSNTSTSRDSVAIRNVYVHDTTFVDRYHSIVAQNDTVYKHDSIYIYIERYNNRYDTIQVVKSDTVRIVEQKTVEVVKPIGKFVRNSCIALWVIIAVVVLGMVAWIAWKAATGQITWRSLISWIPKLISRILKR